MNTVNPTQIYTLYVDSGAISFSDADYDYRYYRLIVTGAPSALVNITLNDQTFDLAGGIVIDAPIYQLTVNSGDGVLLFGSKSVRQIF